MMGRLLELTEEGRRSMEHGLSGKETSRKRKRRVLHPSLTLPADKILSGSGLQVLALLLDECTDTLGEQGDVERLLERFAVAVLRQGFWVSLIFAGQSDDKRGFVGWIAPQVLGDLQRLATSHGQIDDDGIRMEAFRLDTGLEAAVGHFVLIILILRQQLFEAFDEQLLGADNEDLVPS